MTESINIQLHHRWKSALLCKTSVYKSWIQMWVEKIISPASAQQDNPPSVWLVCAYGCKHQIKDDSLGFALCTFIKGSKERENFLWNTHVTKCSCLYEIWDIAAISHLFTIIIILKKPSRNACVIHAIQMCTETAYLDSHSWTAALLDGLNQVFWKVALVPLKHLDWILKK